MDKQIALLLGVPCIFELIHWYAYVRHVRVSPKRKALYLAVDYLHNFVVFLTLFLLLTSAGNMKRVLFLNSIYILYVIQFFIFKRCSLSVLHNSIIGPEHQHNFVDHFSRAKYIFSGKYNVTNGTSEHAWMHAHIWQFSLLLLINIYTLMQNT